MSLTHAPVSSLRSIELDVDAVRGIGLRLDPDPDQLPPLPKRPSHGEAGICKVRLILHVPHPAQALLADPAERSGQVAWNIWSRERVTRERRERLDDDDRVGLHEDERVARRHVRTNSRVDAEPIR